MRLPDYIQNAKDLASMTGWELFPTNPELKTPCIKNPFGKATNDLKEVVKLFRRFPGAGIGIPTGPMNQITVIDIDRKNGIDGWSNFKKLRTDIVNSGVVRTPSGGLHLYFDTGHQEIPNSVSKIAPGIDVRGAGGYVQGANTVTREGRYRWDLRFIPPFRKLPKMPLKLLQLCLDGTERANYSITKQRSSIKKDLMSLVSEGSRNSTMASRIGYLIKKLDHETAWRAAVHINNKCCKPPLPDRELERTFQSILCREFRHG